ncbi:MAG: hypothetical protein GY940_46990, partial [bacterium]|nr:hypothetical protein [bacterium]
MKTKQKTIVLMIMTLFLSGLGLQAASAVYHTPDEVNNELKKLAGSNPGIAKLHRLAVSPGGLPV